MNKTLIEKELYELDLQKVALEAEIKQHEAAKERFASKRTAIGLGQVGSLVALFVPGGFWVAGPSLLGLSSLQSRYDKEVQCLQASLYRCREEIRLAERRQRALRIELADEKLEERAATRAARERQSARAV